MKKQITEHDYQDEIKKIINKSIDAVNILYDPRLFVGGFSLIHITDEQRKQALILSLRGMLIYKDGQQEIQANVDFEKNIPSAEQFKDEAEKIKREIMKSTQQVKEILFENASSKVTLLFDNETKLIAQTLDQKTKPLSFDNTQSGYAVHFDEETNGEGNFNFLKVVYKR